MFEAGEGKRTVQAEEAAVIIPEVLGTPGLPFVDGCGMESGPGADPIEQAVEVADYHDGYLLDQCVLSLGPVQMPSATALPLRPIRSLSLSLFSYENNNSQDAARFRGCLKIRIRESEVGVLTLCVLKPALSLVLVCVGIAAVHVLRYNISPSSGTSC